MDFTSASESEILRHARSLVRKTLRELHGNAPSLPSGKGAFGQLLEILHFGYSPNSNRDPDFPAAQLELKATGVVRSGSGRWRAKERLVLSIIDYHSIAMERAFASSAFYRKNGRILLVAYVWNEELTPLDYRILLVDGLELDDLQPLERTIIEEDWEKIRDTVIAGRAHELSEADTYYLAACRKGAGRGRDDRTQPFSPEPALQRAYSFKASFVTRLVQRMLAGGAGDRAEDEQNLVDSPDELTNKSLDDLVMQRFERFRGMPVEQIRLEVDPNLNPSAKGYYAGLARRMLGVRTRKIVEFENADVLMKTVRIQANGRPKESMSFPYFKYMDLTKSSWEDSDLRDTLSKRFLFVFFLIDNGVVRFSHAAFWAMPLSTLDGEVKKVWKETVRRISSGRAHDLPGSKFSDVAHVRPHGRDASDTDLAPDGRYLAKKCFWLNASYIGKIYSTTLGPR